MQTIPWNDSYLIGNADIDRQHKMLLAIINQLIEEQRDAYNAQKFSTAVHALIHYAYSHFATEEQYFTKGEYPDAQTHIMQHIDFIIKMMNLVINTEHGTDEDRKELLRFLKEWYGRHVLELDREYIPYLLKK